MAKAAKYTNVSCTTHCFLWLCVLLCVAFVAWAYIGRLDIVSMAEGEVVPSSLLKRVQHLEGGIVQEIYVREGEAVVAGQELVSLEGIQSGSSAEEIRVRVASLSVDVVRLSAQAENASVLTFPAELTKMEPERVEAAQQLFASSRSRLTRKLAEISQEERRYSIRITKSRKGLGLLKKELRITEELLEDQLATELQYIKLKREVNNLESRIEQDKAALAKARAGRESEVAAFKEKAREGLHRTHRELAEFSERLKKVTDTLNRTAIRSPVEGVIKQMAVTAPGEVVEPGGTVLTIVPSSDKLVVEAHLAISDIGYVEPGQEALISLASADARRFGRLEGKVARISPDAFTDRRGATYYKVRVETDSACFERGGNKYCLYPGMVVACSIHTGTRTVLEYLVSPFVETMSFSLQER